MSAAPSTENVASWPGEIPIQSSYTAGKAGQRFFAALQQDGRLLATRCADCQQVYFPARRFCERCFSELTDELELAPTGVIASFTFCRFDRDRQPLTEPVALALVRLEGATTLFLHYLLDVSEPTQLAIGAAVEVVLKAKERRDGSILDVAGFRLART